MLKKYKLSVKSFHEKKIYGRIYDITVGKHEFQNIDASYTHYCDNCKYSSKCPYYFDKSENYSLYEHCLADYNLIGSMLLCFLGFITILDIIIFTFFSSKYKTGIPIIIIIGIAQYIIKKSITPIVNCIEGIALICKINKEKGRNQYLKIIY